MKYNLPVILLNGTILIPQNELKLEFEDELSKSIIDEAELFHDNKVLVVTKLSLEENIIIKDLPKIGTVAEITRKLELPNGKVRVILKGKSFCFRILKSYKRYNRIFNTLISKRKNK